jgi:ribosomal protein S18 acetylase RimI-like enzyme
MIRACSELDVDAIWHIINDGAQAYKGIIPPDRWKEPYMPRHELQKELEAGVEFWGYQEKADLVGVMGVQKVADVTLIRHAYVRTQDRKLGVGSRLLLHLQNNAVSPILIGTWADAYWAIRFYEKHGFRLVGLAEKERLLRRYWKVPDRQIETSVVLVEQSWPAASTQ